MNKLMKKVISSCNDCNYLAKLPNDNLSNYEDAYCLCVNKKIDKVINLSNKNFNFPDFCPLDFIDEEVFMICKGCSNCEHHETIQKENIKKINIYCKKINKLVYENINIESFCYKPLSCPYL